MLIGIRKRFIFVCNSKAASTSVESVLAPYAEIKRSGSPKGKHIPWSDVLHEYDYVFSQSGFEPETFFKFGIIRDPIDWVRSWFNYRLDNPKVDNPLPAGTNFADWWRDGKDWVKHVPQSRVFDAPGGSCGMDLLVPLESLGEAMPKVLEALGTRIKTLPWKNTSPVTLAASEIEGELRDEIREHYAKDLDLYQFWKAHWRERLDAYSRPTIGWRRFMVSFIPTRYARFHQT